LQRPFFLAGARMFDKAIDELSEWIAAGNTGCAFAYRLAHRGESGNWWRPMLHFGQSFGPELTERIDIDVAGAMGGFESIQLVFPDVVTAQAVAELVACLCKSPRWYCVQPPRDEQPPETFPVGLRYKLPGERYVSYALGLAPLETMPMTRRARCTAIVMRVGPPGPALEILLERPEESRNRKPLQTGPGAGLIPVNLADLSPHASASEVSDLEHATKQLRTRRLAGDPMTPYAHVTVSFSLPMSVRPALNGSFS
jgi:hypothetical protein